MGDGFQYNENKHHYYEYNSLLFPKSEDKNTMRTKYLIQDVWSNKQIKDLIIHCKQILKEREE